MTAFLYVLMIFVWGFSWIAIKWQQTEVPTEVSIFYRFVIAAVTMLIIGKLFNKLQAVRWQHQLYFALQGLCLCSLNFIAFYYSTNYIASGLTAVTMATAPIFNAIHGRLIYKTQISTGFLLGAPLGLVGITLLFAGDVTAAQWSTQELKGLMFALVGTWFFSMGNMISIRNYQHNIEPFTATSYAMVYGCVALLLIILVQGLDLLISSELRYMASLLYLGIPASVIGFTVYLILVNKIGANNAAYLLVITPVVALFASSIYEDYTWTPQSVTGLLLVVAGNVVIQMKYRPFESLLALRKLWGNNLRQDNS